MRLENIPFRLESELFKAWYAFSKGRPSSRPFVSGDSFRSLADHVVEPACPSRSQVHRDREMLFLFRLPKSSRFSESILPLYFRALCSCHPQRRPQHRPEIFGARRRQQNPALVCPEPLFRHPKLTAVPIGLENRCLHSHGVISDFRRLAGVAPTKSNRILYGFTVENNPAERVPAV